VIAPVDPYVAHVLASIEEAAAGIRPCYRCGVTAWECTYETCEHCGDPAGCSECKSPAPGDPCCEANVRETAATLARIVCAQMN